MTTLYKVFVILSAAILLANAQHLSDLDLEKNLRVNPPVTTKKVLKAFVEANPRLPRELANGGLSCTVLYTDNRAIIDVLTGSNPYYGLVEVYVNGAQPYTPGSPNSSSYGPGKLNLSRLNDLNRSLDLRRSGVTVNNDEQGRDKIIETFMSKNHKLPSELRQKLKVKNITRNSAVLYVVPSADYEGEVFVNL